MEYIIQIFSGGWNVTNYSSGQIINRIKQIDALIPTKKVIIGWNMNRQVYQEVGEYLHSKGINMLLWLPVFSEIGSIKSGSMAVDVYGKKIGSVSFQKEEDFTFYCPSDMQNIQNVIEVYSESFAECGFDGVFLDKIRSQSFVVGWNGVLSCGCRKCIGEYKKRGFDIELLKHELQTKGDRLFDVVEYSATSGYKFENELAEKFFSIKADIITKSVTMLCRFFKEKNLEVGLDLYAPLISPFVGQDIKALSREADFIKPMMYRMTNAPAGIQYEYTCIKNSVPRAQGLLPVETDVKFLYDQLNGIRDAACRIYPGVEVNYREDIARTNPDYIKESLEEFRRSSMDGAVLSWDVMLAPDSHIEAVLLK